MTTRWRFRNSVRQMIQWGCFQRLIPNWPWSSCNIPRLPMNRPRILWLMISPVGVTRFCQGTVLFSPQVRSQFRQAAVWFNFRNKDVKFVQKKHARPSSLSIPVVILTVLSDEEYITGIVDQWINWFLIEIIANKALKSGLCSAIIAHGWPEQVEAGNLII